jgi:hypothetical protein
VVPMGYRQVTLFGSGPWSRQLTDRRVGNEDDLFDDSQLGFLHITTPPPSVIYLTRSPMIVIRQQSTHSSIRDP